MSDATLPTSDPPLTHSDARPVQSSDSISSEGDVFPLLVHSQHSVTHGEPPDVDNGKLARQKRKRTSAEDQATLEREYNLDPKPDKAARLEIVKRVSLGEKEVQIWFQNRRQNTRRKSRPLLPHEIAAFGLGGMAALTSNTHARNSSARIEDINRPSLSSGEMLSGIQKEEQRLDNGILDWDPVSRPILTKPETESAEAIDANLSKVGNVKMLIESRSSGANPPAELLKNLQQSHSSQPPLNTLGYLSNRRIASLNIRDTSASTQPSKPTNVGSRLSVSMYPDSANAEDDLSSVSSQVRLSMSLDGKAELVSLQLSPQRPQQPLPMSTSFEMSHRRTGLKRSHSAIPIGHVRHNAISGLPHVPRIPSGRSRDARTWEFCCDTDTRDELTTQAENESSGSAVAAISLLRSTNVTLKANTNKRTTLGPKPDSQSRSKRSKLGRASSLTTLKNTYKGQLGSPSGDSDKENWLPFDDSGNSQRRDLAAARPSNRRRQQVLVDSASGLLKAADQRQLRASTKSAISYDVILEDDNGKNGTNSDVEKFMKGEVSPSKKGDLDCIQGLLSLSQGIWR